MKIFFKIIKHELNYFFKNKLSMIMLFFIPAVLTVFFGGLYSYQKVTEVKVAVVDEDNTALSRMLAENINVSEKFTVVEYLQEPSKIGEYLDNNEVDAVFLIPAGFARDIKKSKPVEVGTFLDGSNMLIANTVLSGANEVVMTTQAGVLIKNLQGMGIPPEKSKNLAQLVQFRSRVWYNPAFNYTNFLVLGLIATVIQQITLFQTAQSFIRDKIHGTYSVWKNAGVGFVSYYFAKMVSYWSSAVFNTMLTLSIANIFFDIPLRGNAVSILLLIAVFSSAITTLGFLFSIIAKTEMFANQLAMTIASPAFLISGFTWPLSAMPVFFQTLGKMIPLTHFLLAIRAAALRGAGFLAISNYIVVLLIMTLIFALVSILKLRKVWNDHAADHFREEYAGESITV